MQIPGRDDVTEELVHFTKGETDEIAADVLWSILTQHLIVGGTGFIRGQYRCVCFTEAPLSKIAPTIAQANSQGRRYRPFGVIVRKDWLYALGGRPVIYGPDQQFDELPVAHKWRHVRYELAADDTVDFSWEREWRVHVDQLQIDPACARFLVPDSMWAERIVERYEEDQELLARQNAILMGDDFAQMSYEPFPWQIDLLASNE